MSDHDLPELPSDEELGIAGMELDEEERGPRRKGDAPPTPSPPPPGDTDGSGGARRKAAASPPPERPVRRWRGPLTLAILLATAWAVAPDRVLPDPAPATAPDTSFSSARAMVEMVELARRAHPPGSPEHARVRQRIVGTLEELGLEPGVHTSTSWIRRGRSLHAATVRNVVARLPGTESTGAVLITAHYDGRTLSPAAGDDASGVVAILETVRALRAGAPLRNDLVVLITDGEEIGLLGARAFVREHPWMRDVAVVLSVEMRGGGGPSIMFETGDDNGWIIRALQAGDPRPMANSLSFEVYRRLPNDTDFTPFREAGKQGLNFAGIGRGRVYHQTFDTPDNFQEATLQHHGVHLLGMVRELGGRDLTTVAAPDRVFFRLPVLGLVTYATLWIPVLGVVLLLAGVAVALAGVRSGVRVGGLAAGLVLGLVATAGAAGAGWGLFRWVRGLHPEYGHLAGSAFHSEGWYVLALAAAAFAIVTGLFGVARRRGSLAGLSAGAMILPLLGALFLTFAVPLAAMNLQWPVLAGLVGAALVIGLTGPRPPGLVRWLPLLALSAPVLAFMVPLTELVWMAMNVSVAPVLGGLAALTLLLLVPLLDVLNEPNRWWAPAAGLILAGAFLGTGLLRSRPSPDRPTPSTLTYTLDRETGQAGWATRPGPGLDWARARAGALETEGTLEAFFAGDGPVLTGPATVAAVERLEAGIAADSAAGVATSGETGGDREVTAAGAAGRPYRIALRSRAGAELMTVHPTPGADVRWLAVNGRPIEGGSPITSIRHWGEPEGALYLDLVPAAGADSVRLVVVEHHLRPGELVGEEPFRRPPDLVPAVDGVSDRALIRTVVTLPVGPGPAGASGPADTLASPADTAAAPADTTAGDTTVIPADTTVAVGDTLPAAAGSAGGPAHPVPPPVDTVRVPGVRRAGADRRVGGPVPPPPAAGLLRAPFVP